MEIDKQESVRDENKPVIKNLSRSELHPIKKTEMSSRFRAFFGPLFCIVGLHN